MSQPKIQRDKDWLPLHSELKCFVRKVLYDFEDRSGVIYLGDYSSAHCPALINLFKSIDPDVTLILAIAAKRPAVYYVLVGGEWEVHEGALCAV